MPERQATEESRPADAADAGAYSGACRSCPHGPGRPDPPGLCGWAAFCCHSCPRLETGASSCHLPALALLAPKLLRCLLRAGGRCTESRQSGGCQLTSAFESMGASSSHNHDNGGWSAVSWQAAGGRRAPCQTGEGGRGPPLPPPTQSQGPDPLTRTRAGSAKVRGAVCGRQLVPR